MSRDHRLVLAKTLDDRLDLGQRFGELPVLGRIALHLGGAEAVHQLFGLPLDRREFIEHNHHDIQRGDRRERAEPDECLRSLRPRR